MSIFTEECATVTEAPRRAVTRSGPARVGAAGARLRAPRPGPQPRSHLSPQAASGGGCGAGLRGVFPGKSGACAMLRMSRSKLRASP